MRPAQCKTLVFAICLMSILKGLKKPPPASSVANPEAFKVHFQTQDLQPQSARPCVPEMPGTLRPSDPSQQRGRHYGKGMGQPAGSPLLKAPLKSMRPASCSAMRASVRTYLFL